MQWVASNGFEPAPLHAIRPRLHEVKGQRVLLRVDLNIPTTRENEVLCNYRLRRIVGLVEILSHLGCRVILISHFGRPDGRPDPALSLKHLAPSLARLLRPPLTLLPDCVGPEVEQAIDNSPAGSVFLLENLRFHPGEITADPDFGRQLARLGDCFINDAFSVSHRPHASTIVLPQLMRSYAGPAFVDEYHRALSLLELIRPPVVVISGGQKLEKLNVYRRLMSRIDSLLIGSGFAGHFVTNPEVLGGSHEIMRRVVHPLDLQVSKPDGSLQVVSWQDLQPGDAAIDVGPLTIERYCSIIRGAGTLFFNGSIGILPARHPASSLERILEGYMASRGLKVVFGGTGCSLFIRSGLANYVNFIFPGGGALLRFLYDQSNPAIAALCRNGFGMHIHAAPAHMEEDL